MPSRFACIEAATLVGLHEKGVLQEAKRHQEHDALRYPCAGESEPRGSFHQRTSVRGRIRESAPSSGRDWDLPVVFVLAVSIAEDQDTGPWMQPRSD